MHFKNTLGLSFLDNKGLFLLSFAPSFVFINAILLAQNNIFKCKDLKNLHFMQMSQVSPGNASLPILLTYHVMNSGMFCVGQWKRYSKLLWIVMISGMTQEKV
jgi:uncharacterized membrane protein required for colicin V production